MNKSGIHMAKEGSFLTSEEAHVIVQRSNGLVSFDIVGLRVEPWSLEPTGYCSAQLRITIKVKLQTGSCLEFNYFAKGIPDSKDNEPYLSQYYSKYFLSEFVFFNEILPAFRVGPNSLTPRCFYSRTDLLVMEDLSQEGFTTPSSRDLMPYDECMAGLHALAHLHAASIAFEEHHPQHKTIIDLWPDIFNTHTAGSGDVDNWLLAGIKTLEYLADIVPGIYKKEELKKLLIVKRNQIINTYSAHNKISYSRNVLSHGDIWQSNTLRRRSADGKHVDVRLIDFQVLCYAPLGYDVIFFLHQVFDSNSRRQHEDSLLSAYYKALGDILQSYSIDVNSILKYQEFIDSCNTMRPRAIIGAAIYHPHSMLDAPYLEEIFSSQEKAHTFMYIDRSEYVLKGFQNDPLYRLRISDSFSQYIEWFRKECK